MLCFLWFVSHHVATVWNLNLFYCSPVALVLLFGIWGDRTYRPNKLVASSAGFVMLAVVIGVALTLIGVQQNQVIAQLTALPTLVLAFGIMERLSRRRDEALPLPQ